MRKILLALFVGALALTACGGDDSSSGSALSKIDGSKLSGDEKKAYDEVLSAMSDDEDDLGATEEQQACVAANLVKKAGVKGTLAIAAKDGEGLTKTEAGQVVDSMSACVNLSELFVQGMAEGVEISDKSADCLKKEFDNGKLRDFMVTAMMAGADEEPPADFLADAMKAMTKCLSDKELAGLGG